MNVNDAQKLLREGFKQLAAGDPRRLAIGASAAVIAPFFVRGENRDYTQSAMITTPVVAAATLVGPDLFASSRESFNKVSGFTSRTWAQRPWNRIKTNLRAGFFRSEYSSGRMAKNEFVRRAAEFYNDFTPVTRDLPEEIRHVSAALEATLADPKKHFMLANVIFSEEYRNASAAELAAGAQQMLTDPDAMRKAVAAKLTASNPQYIREMGYRLSQIKDINDLGPGRMANAVDEFGDPIIHRTLGRRAWSSRYGRRSLLSQDREAFREIHRAIKSGKIDSRDIQLVSFDNPTNKSINRIVGLEIGKGKNSVRVGLLQSDNMVYTGKYFERRGYMRDVASLHGGIMRGDIWAVRNAGDLESLKKNFGSIQFASFPDGDDTFNTMKETAATKFRQKKQVAFLRRNEVVFDPLSGFGDGSVGWEKLADRPGLQEQARLAMMEKLDLVPMGPTGSFRHVMQKGEMAKAVTAGVINYADQAPEVRWMKPIYLDTSTKIPGFHAPHSRTSFLQNQGIIEPMMGSSLHGTSSQLKNLVEILPNDRNILMGPGGHEISRRAKEIIAREWRERGIKYTSRELDASWGLLRGWLSEGKNLKNVRKLGYLGEGTTLVLGPGPRTIVERTAYLDAGSVRVDLDEMAASGRSFDNQLLLGTRDKNLITAQGESNVIKGYEAMTDGRIAVHYDEHVHIAHAKTDHLTKGHMMATTEAEAQAIRDFTGLYHATLKTGDTMPDDVALMALRVYNQDKARATSAIEKQSADLLRRLQEGGDMAIAAPYLDKLKEQGYNYVDGSLVWDAARTIEHTPGGEAVIAARRAQHAQNVAVMQEMFDHVSMRINEVHSPALRAYTRRQNQSESLLDYSFRNFAAVDLTAWNTTGNTIADRVSITYDMFGAMGRRGMDEVLKDIRNRSRIDGDIGMTQELMAKINDKNYAGLPTKTVGEAFPELFSGEGLSSAEFRAGSVFDPKSEFAAKNWAVQLGEGESLPVLGHEAYGGKINMYGEGLFSVNKRETALVDAIQAYGTPKYEEAKEAYLNSVRYFGYGKENWMRAPRVDPMGISGRLQNAPSPWGVEHQLAVGISPEDLSKIHSEEIREAIKAGEGYAIGFRHPVSTSAPLRVYVDPNLDKGVFGLAEGARGIYMADNDGDNLLLSMLEPKTKGYAEAKRMAEELNSVVHQEMRIHRALEGVADYTQLAGGDDCKPLSERIGKELAQDAREAVRRRTAGGAVGRMSNVLTEAAVGLELNTNITDPMKRMAIEWPLWESLRQVTIRAQKKSETGTGLARMLAMADQVESGMRDRGESGFQRFYTGLQDLAQYAGKEVEGKYLEDIGLDLKQATEVSPGKYNGLMETIRQNEETWRSFHAGIPAEAAPFARAMTANAESAAFAQHFKRGGRALDSAAAALPYLGAPVAGARAESRGATMAAEMLGAINEASKEVSGSVRRAAKSRAGKILGIGLGVAALAGIVSTPIEPAWMPPVPSGNRFRPEDRSGVADDIPGEPVPGSMAPTGPPRRVVAGPSSVRTAYVAPIHSAVDLEVKTKTADRERSVEQAKLMARMSTDGHSNITINYRGSGPQSLRMQEKVREQQERNY
jgi:hypothetical protein